MPTNTGSPHPQTAKEMTLNDMTENSLNTFSWWYQINIKITPELVYTPLKNTSYPVSQVGA